MLRSSAWSAPSCSLSSPTSQRSDRSSPPASCTGAARGWGLYLAAAIALLALCLPASGVLAPAVVVYGLCLITMAVLATGVHAMIWVGGGLFLVSDGLIATNAFDVFSAPQHDLVVMTTYIAAQLLLVLGALAVSETRDQPLARAAHHAPVVPPQ